MSGKKLTNLGEYVQMRLNSDQNVSPTVVYRDYQVLYGSVHPTTSRTVYEIVKQKDFLKTNQQTKMSSTEKESSNFLKSGKKCVEANGVYFE